MKNKILTAEEFIEKEYSSVPYELEDITQLMIKFATLHCIEQTRVISEKAIAKQEYNNLNPEIWVDKDSILNAYPLTNIK